MSNKKSVLGRWLAATALASCVVIGSPALVSSRENLSSPINPIENLGAESAAPKLSPAIPLAKLVDQRRDVATAIHHESDPAPKIAQAIPAGHVVTDAQKTDISPVFKLVFLTVVFLTVVSGIASTAMAFIVNASEPDQQAVFETMNTAWKLGLGAIVGLLGAKAN